MNNDLISREALKININSFIRKVYNGEIEHELSIFDAIAYIDNAPTVTPIDETFSTAVDKYGDNTFSVSVISSKGEKIDFERVKKGEWIPVEERLPQIATKCLVTLSNGYITIGEYFSIDKWVFIETSFSMVYPKETVIAWMPLSEPYKMGGEGDD